MIRGNLELIALAVTLVTTGGCGSGSSGAGGGSGGTHSGTSGSPGGAATGGSGGTGSGTSQSTGGSGTGGAADAGPDCAGQCLAAAPAFWQGPVLMWMGDPQAAPACPADAPSLVHEGHADLDAPAVCAACTCGPPGGACTLPDTMTANAATCAMNGASTPHTPFSPAAGWDGACDTNDSIPSGKLCSGVKCVQSLTIGPLTLVEQPCVASATPAPTAVTWKTVARACSGTPAGSCGAGSVCAPATPAGFQACIRGDGDQACPTGGPFTDRHVFYDDLQDSRACSACACGSPSGSSCSSTVSVYGDGACSALAYSTTIAAGGSACHDLPPGTPLGSKSATTPTFTAGACAPSGGVAQGSASPAAPFTLCCVP